jgi:hypothetical protein
MITKFIAYVGGIGSFGTISVCLFITVFTGALIWAWCQNKTFLNKMSTMPLNDGTVPHVSKPAVSPISKSAPLTHHQS